MTKPTLHDRWIIRDASGQLITGGLRAVDEAIASARRLSKAVPGGEVFVVKVTETVAATVRDGNLTERSR